MLALPHGSRSHAQYAQFLIPFGMLPYRIFQCIRTLLPLPFKLPLARAKLSSSLSSFTVSDCLRYSDTCHDCQARRRRYCFLWRARDWFLDDSVGLGILTWPYFCPETGLSLFPMGSGINRVSCPTLPCYYSSTLFANQIHASRSASWPSCGTLRTARFA